MDHTKNPFSPNAGSPPPELAGRKAVIDQAIMALERIKHWRSEKSLLMVGLRGVGKTVLLVKIDHLAKERGYQTVFIEAHESRQKKTLAELLIPPLRRTLITLDRGERLGEYTRKAIGVLKSFMQGLKVKTHDIEISYEAEAGVADSGDLETDLADLLEAVGYAAKEKNTAIALIIDEMQYLDEVELSALIMAMHRTTQRSLPVLVIGAGLPQLVGKTGNSKSYAERLFHFPEIGPLSKQDCDDALQYPAKSQGVAFTEEAIHEIYTISQGYPYFIQEWGYHAWNTAPASPISLHDVRTASPLAVKNLDDNFFRVRFDRLTPSEKLYVRAMAELGAKPQRSGDIAELLHKPVSQVAPLRAQLINKGMIYSPSHGITAFTVPLFETFLKRKMPTLHLSDN